VLQEETRERQVKEPKASSTYCSNTVVEHRGDSQASWKTPTLAFKGTSECLMEVKICEQCSTGTLPFLNNSA